MVTVDAVLLRSFLSCLLLFLLSSLFAVSVANVDAVLFSRACTVQWVCPASLVRCETRHCYGPSFYFLVPCAMHRAMQLCLDARAEAYEMVTG